MWLVHLVSRELLVPKVRLEILEFRFTVANITIEYREQQLHDRVNKVLKVHKEQRVKKA